MSKRKAKPKPKTGRPARGATAANNVVVVRVTDDEKQSIADAAKQTKASVAEFIRDASLTAARKAKG